MIIPEDALMAAEALEDPTERMVRTWLRSEPNPTFDLDVTFLPVPATPDAIVTAVREAARDGQHLILCCTHEAMTLAAASVAEEVGIPIISPSPGSVRSAEGWHVSIASDPAEELKAIVGDAYRRGARRIAVMMMDGTEGDILLSRIPGFFGAPGLELVGRARYEPGSETLTPEALWVATRLPDIVIAWGSPDDARTAVASLRARDWHGPVYLPFAATRSTAIRLPLASEGEVRAMVPPVAVWTFLAGDEPAFEAIIEARAWAGASGLDDEAGLNAARLRDALRLIDDLRNSETLTQSLEAGTVGDIRLELARQLTSLDPRTGATGLLDPDPRIAQAGRAQGLLPVRLVNDRLQRLPDLR